MEPVTYCKTGARHLSVDLPSQDAVLWRETPDYRLIALADGVSACKNSRLGAETACAAAADYYLRCGEALAQYPDEKVAGLIMGEVLFALKRVAKEQGIDPESLSSTLTFCCIDKLGSEIMIFHLGDGAVFVLGDSVSMAVKPYRTKGAPPQTMTPDAYQYVRIHRMLLPRRHKVLICSDGLLDLWEGESGDAIRTFLSRQDFTGLSEYLNAAEPEDDCSYIVC